ncbi:hypothetical protein FVA81_18100 [Rhizobium sp. WL3]|uniref:hypothetical protein n=1 Tax=Rhizobium sp. WL3 TaxID=2603277 RepID=UPI0011C20AC6|nr:hypothetical protein [Rhizobium sp. WL3]QEE46405.1 hypothetical protein FVA81_18100 [Rhizobium sp. WL3]
MSIEDPRLSSIDNTSAADEFDSAVEQHLGFGSETGRLTPAAPIAFPPKPPSKRRQLSSRAKFRPMPVTS